MGDGTGLVREEKVLVLTSVVIKCAFLVFGPENVGLEGLPIMVNTLVSISPWISVHFFSSLASCSPLDVDDKPDFLEERKDAFLGNHGNNFGGFFGFVKDGSPSFSGRMQ